ncbi:hypothetical protein EGH24_06040 [Halonotius terrestris]|uniref:Uncharacterized protein n=1 Tax=Halonotius terrestris TaxID=2487750 RepID=A0A8J8PD39_9EURY|nr:hypothetical protein [Halonotius terrestris]TQQ82992.1 hypothetical protein EGH24_06040 [Halonotius terrestris]
MKKHLFILAAVVLLCSTPATAQTDTDNGGIADSIDNLFDELSSFTDSWDETLESVVRSVLFDPFLALLNMLVSILATLLLHTPDVYPNPAVEEVYQQSLLISYLLATLAFMAAGLLHMIGPVLGVSYREVRIILPRVIAALVFASVALPLLQYQIDLANALTYAFRPDILETSIGEMYGTAATIAIVWVINSWLLLVVVLIFVVRSAYLMFIAAISPLLALGWSLPKVKRYADSFIAGWFTALMMAPLDMIVLKFTFTLMSGQGANLGQSIANWIFGMASAVLLILVPYQLYGASQAVVGQAYAVTGSVKTRWKKRKRAKRREKRQRDWHRYRQERLKQHGNKPDYRDSVVGGDD